MGQHQSQQLCQAASEGDANAVELLLAKRQPHLSGLDINAWSSVVSFALPPLTHAVRGNPKRPLRPSHEKQQLQIIQMLLDARASPNAPGEGGLRPLHVAQTVGVMKALLEAHANVNAVDEGGSTALIRATYSGRVDLVRCLLDYGADPGCANSDGETALDVSAFVNKDVNAEQCKALIRTAYFAKLSSALDAFLPKDPAGIVVSYVVQSSWTSGFSRRRSQ